MKRKYFVDYLFSIGGLFILIIFVGKFYYLLELNLPLSYDESYYWDWSRKPDWGYYSKPPMVAWLIYLSTKLVGTSEVGVRLPALLSQIGVIIIFYVLVFKYYGELIARSLLFTLAFVPIFLLYSFIMTIDPPLLFFWALFTYSFVEFLRKPSLFWATMSGITLGFSLLTKQTSLLLLILTFFYILVFERDLRLRKVTYLIFLLALLLYLPNIYWNWKHNFLLLKHTEEHFERFFPGYESYLKFWLGLLILYGPIFIIFFFYFGFLMLKKLKDYKKKLGQKGDITDGENFPVKILFLSYLFSFIPLIFFLLLSFFIEFNLNWIMPFFMLSYLWVIPLTLQRKVFRFFMNINLILTFIFSLILLNLPFRPELLGNSSLYLFKKFYGWRELAKIVEKHYDGKNPLLVRGRDLASSLAFYLPSHPEIYVINFEVRPQNQYHIWRKDEDLIGKEVCYIHKGWAVPTFLKEVSLVEKVKLNFYGMEKSFSIWKGVFLGVKAK